MPLLCPRRSSACAEQFSTVSPRAGYERQAVKLVFSDSGIKVVALKELPAPVKPPTAKTRGASRDDWKDIYVRPGNSSAK